MQRNVVRPAPKDGGAADRGAIGASLSADDWADAEFGPGLGAVLSAFADVSADLARGRSLDALLGLIAARTCELTSLLRCAVYLRDDATGLFHGRAGYQRGHDIDTRVRRLTAGFEADRFTREIVETQQPVFVADAALDPRPVRAAMREWDVRAMLGVPMVLLGEVIGILYLDNEDEPHPFARGTREIGLAFANLAAMAIAQARAATELRENLTKATRQNEVWRRSNAFEDQLTALSLDGADQLALVAALAERTGKPCAFFDAAHRCRAYAGPAAGPGADVAGVGGVGAPAIGCGPAGTMFDDLPERAAALEAALALHEEAAVRPVVIGPLPEVGIVGRVLVAPVRDGGTVRGRIVVAEHVARLGSLDVHFARHAARHLELAIASDRRQAGFEQDARAAFTRDLVGGDIAEVGLRRRAALFGFDLTADHVVALFAQRGGAVSGPGAEVLADALTLELARGSVLTVAVPEGVAAVLPLGTAPVEAALRDATAAVARVLAQVDRAGALVVAASEPCAGAAGVARAFQDVAQVQRCQLRFLGTDSARLLTVAELGPARVFLCSADRREVERYVQQTLGELLADKRASVSVLRTLGAFFDGGQTVRGAATLLGVHENTIRYRLSRVQDVTGFDVVNRPQDQLAVQIALLVVRLRGDLPRTDGA